MVTLINPPSRLHYLRAMRSPANLGHLGNSVLCPGPVKSQLDSLAAQLKQASDDLTATQSQVLAASQAGQDMAAEGQLVGAQRQDLETMISALTYGYRTFCGAVPPGLSGMSCGCASRRGGSMGLGILPAIPLGTAAVLIAGLVAALAAWWIAEKMMKDSVNAKVATVQQTQQENIGYAQQQLANAIASGDTDAAAKWQAVIASNQVNPAGQPAGNVIAWISDNWPWVALGVGGLFLARKIL